MKDFKFKLVDLTFGFKELPKYDQEYLRTMVFETIGQKSVKSSGRSFNEMYPNDDIAFANGGDRNKENTLEMSIKDIEFIFDVGGARSDRKQWIH